MRLEILDSMLRDGAQGENISFSVQDKLNIVRILDEFGVTYIEAGNPGSNPKDIEFFEKIKKVSFANAKLVAFGSTRRKGIKASDDSQVMSLMGAETPAVAIFGKSWDIHVTKILKASLAENLEIIGDTLRFFAEEGKEVIFDAEHFFDGYKAKPKYALSVLQVAKEAGANVICLCDTNGGTSPMDIYKITDIVCKKFPDLRVGIHCHNDTGCAVASSMMAVEAGASHVQGTFIGIGERCGNADLSTIIANLQIKMGIPCIGAVSDGDTVKKDEPATLSGDLSRLRKTVLKLSDIANCIVENGRPYVGQSAFAHKGGMHIDGVSKLARTFEHIDPSLVGNSRRFLLSEVSGRANILSKMTKIAPELDKNSKETAEVLNRLKMLEHEGYQFEAADASFELMVLKTLGRYKPSFTLKMYKTTGDYPAPDGFDNASALLKIEAFGKTETAAATGNGPVNALDSALRRALCVFYPAISNVHLIDYKVRVLSGSDATASKVRVLIESSDGESIWTTIGVSTDIIEASWFALVDSIEYYLYKKENS